MLHPTAEQEFKGLAVYGKMLILGHDLRPVKTSIQNFGSEQGSALDPNNQITKCPNNLLAGTHRERPATVGVRRETPAPPASAETEVGSLGTASIRSPRAASSKLNPVG